MSQWTDWTVERVWQKARIDWLIDSTGEDYRRDSKGKLIKRDHYGHWWSEYGWEVHHILPEALGGPSVLSNLAALNCHDNRSQQDKFTVRDILNLLPPIQPAASSSSDSLRNLGLSAWIDNDSRRDSRPLDPLKAAAQYLAAAGICPGSPRPKGLAELLSEALADNYRKTHGG